MSLQGQTREEFQRLFDEENLPAGRALLSVGEYDRVRISCEQALVQDRVSDRVAWELIRLSAVVARGAFSEEEVERLEALRDSYPEDIRLLEAGGRWLKGELGRTEEGAEWLRALNEVAVTNPELSRGSYEERLALGRAASHLGASPDQVLERFLLPARKLAEKRAESYLAAGRVALNHYDYARAAKEFRQGIRQDPEHPELRFALAQALWPGDRTAAITALQRAVEMNKRHVGAMLLLAEVALQGENFREVDALLRRANVVSPDHPQVAAMQAAVVWLRDHQEEERDEALARGLKRWPENPLVPHTIGRLLSKNYRFAEGADYQRQALDWEEGFLPAKMALASDFLKLGREEEAWKLAKEVADEDRFHVLAYNYGLLEKQLAAYDTRETEHFILRMAP
ncbi:MAG: tetratricopeptide repeat protein, partial [Verrucomicrobiota bacterium]